MVGPSVTTKVSIEGLQKFVKKVGIATGNANLKPALSKSMDKILSLLKKYPPPLPNQRYVRTGNLGRSWQSRVTSVGSNQFSSTMRGEVRNSMRYASFVQGSNQANIHKGRWITADQAVDQVDDEIGADIISVIDKVL